ncbi:MAG: sugar ABC transporter permease [Oscillospiraceae bacterium]|nr:sugar ABC transporter permease [Oscillospiraceae bacterium]
MNISGKIKEIKRCRECYFMLMPFMLFFIIFTVIPVIMSVPVAFTDFNMIEYPKFIGLDNFKNLFLNDKIFIKSIRVTLVFAVVTGPLSYILCFMLAWFINQLPKSLHNIFMIIFYAPSMANIYTIWQLIFSGDRYGYFNSILINLGITFSPVQWLTDSRYVLGVVVAVQLWISLGAGFLAFSAGLKNIDVLYYEAGAVEGISNRWQELFYITLPSMKPYLLFAGVIQIVSSFTAGAVAQNIAGFPSTDYKAHTIMTHAYDYGWIRYEMGYASAICVVLFIAMYIADRLLNKVLNQES